MRVAGYHPFKDLHAGKSLVVRECPYKDIGYELTPNSSGFVWGCQVKINSLGFRDREYPLHKPRGTFRIIALGDSVTFGTYRRENETFPSQLESAFQGNGRSVEVLNLAVPGYDTLNEVAQLESMGLRLEPDLVILGFCINDVGVVAPVRGYIRRLQTYGSPVYRLRTLQLIAVHTDRIAMAREFEFDVSEEEYHRENIGRIAPIDDDAKLLALMRQLRHLIADEPRESVKHLFLRWYTSTNRVGRLRYALERLKHLSETHSLPVVLVLIPFLDDADYPEGYQLAYAIIRHEASRLGIRVVEVYEEFRKAGFSRLRGLRNDPIHPTPIGHWLIAERLKTFLQEAGYAPHSPDL